MIINKVYCFFEQSGIFKNEFIKLGIPAEDYDIQNNFGETDNVIDLFSEIEKAYEGEKSCFDNISQNDLILAFFPCIYFSCLSQMAMSWGYTNYHKKQNNVTLEQRIIAYYSGENGWRNKMFTRNEEMPHKIKITGIKQCRLQDISEDECLREGIYIDKEGGRSIGYPFAVSFYCTFRGAINRDEKQLYWSTPKEAFAGLINKLNGKGYWESNPNGYAYEFELVR